MKIYNAAHKEEFKTYKDVNKEKINLQRKQHRQKPDIIEKERLYTRQYYSSHQEECKEKTRVHYRENKDKVLSGGKAHRAVLINKILEHYGKKCACCGETTEKFLTIDHINNDGTKQRKESGIKGSYSMYVWLIRNNYPPEFQILCYNCNLGKARNGGVCPHITNHTPPPL
jgi:hypothetical protein